MQRFQPLARHIAALACCGFALTLLSVSAMAGGPPWMVYTHSVGDQADLVDSSLVGKAHAGKRAFYIEMVRALLSELQIEARISEVPFARGMVYLKTDERVVFFNVTRVPDREEHARWIGPLLDEKSYLYELANKPSGIQSLIDAKSKSVCVLNKGVHDDGLRALGFTNLKRQNSYNDCFRMLAADYVDLVASAENGLLDKLRLAKVEPEMVRRTPALVGVESGYITLSKSTSNEEVERWSNAFKKLEANGTRAKLYLGFAQ